MTLAIPWFQMSSREQFVWAARYAAHAADPAEALRLANQAVLTLRELDLDNERYAGPEYEAAARSGLGLTFEEFRAWYPIALKLAKNGVVSPDEITNQACQDAFEIYQRCSTDYY